jgi:hypothetical protein
MPQCTPAQNFLKIKKTEKKRNSMDRLRKWWGKRKEQMSLKPEQHELFNLNT